MISNSTDLFETTWTAPNNGYIVGSGYGDGQLLSHIYIHYENIYVRQQSSTDEYISVIFPVKAGDTIGIESRLSTNNGGIYFVPSV